VTADYSGKKKRFQEYGNQNRLLTKFLQWTSTPCQWKSYNLRCQSKESNSKNTGKRKWHLNQLIRSCVIAPAICYKGSLTLSNPSLARTSLTFNALHPTPSLSALQNRPTPAPARWALIHRLHLPDLLPLKPYPEM
jgi:hypothetical protein